MIAASIASASMPAALLYIALNHIPDGQFNKQEKELLAGFIFFAATLSNALNTFTSSLMLIAGYQLASYFVDTVADLLTADKPLLNRNSAAPLSRYNK